MFLRRQKEPEPASKSAPLPEDHAAAFDRMERLLRTSLGFSHVADYFERAADSTQKAYESLDGWFTDGKGRAEPYWKRHEEIRTAFNQDKQIRSAIQCLRAYRDAYRGLEREAKKEAERIRKSLDFSKLPPETFPKESPMVFLGLHRKPPETARATLTRWLQSGKWAVYIGYDWRNDRTVYSITNRYEYEHRASPSSRTRCLDDGGEFFVLAVAGSVEETDLDYRPRAVAGTDQAAAGSGAG